MVTLTVPQVVKKLPHFVGLRCSLPYSQEPATCPCLEPHQSSPGLNHVVLFVEENLNFC